MKTYLIISLLSILCTSCGGGSPEQTPPADQSNFPICDMNNWGPQKDCQIPSLKLT